MENTDKCESCEFEPVQPGAQFMFSAVEKCQNCGDVRRLGDDIEHLGIPRQVRELTEE